MPSFIINDSEFRELPQSVQRALTERFFSFIEQPAEPEALGAPESTPAVADEEELPDLSPAQARRMIANVVDKTSRILRFIASSKDGRFMLSDALKDSGLESSSELRGVWAGITRRSRKILGDNTLMLISWTNKEGDGSEGSEWEGRVSEMTHRSLRKAFGIS